MEDNQNYLELWQKVKDLLSKKLRKPSYETWIKPTKLISIADNYATIAVKNDFAKNLVSQSYLNQIQESIKEITATALGVRIIVDPDLEISPEPSEDNKQISLALLETKIEKPLSLFSQAVNRTNPAAYTHNSNLNKKYTLNNFIVDNENKITMAFANAIIDEGSNQYSSLYVNSQPGLGKTHLLNAIGNRKKELNPHSRVKYITTEEFTNDLVSSIRKNSTYDFRKKFRNLDLLLLDDAHFLEGKKTTQEEFYYTFDAITNNGGQVVLSSAKNLEQLDRLEPNLKSRLSGSLMSELSTPQLNTRIEILENIASSQALKLKTEDFELIANKFSSNVRELEGALMKLSVLQSHSNVAIDHELVAELFGSVKSAGQYQGLSIERIAKTVADYFGIKLNEITGKRRLTALTKPRHIAVYLAYSLLQISYNRIGEYFSNRKHSSIIHSINIIKTELNRDKSLALIIDDIKTKLKA